MTNRFFVAVLFAALVSTGAAESRGFGHSAGRVYYGGHGGSYRGAISGSSHRGGRYSNLRTGNRYGRHR
jgi:hypothetical protein